MKQIEVLGSGCRNCNATYELIRSTAAAKGIEIALRKVEDMGVILGYGVLSTPAVVVDGRVVHGGGVPSRQQVETWIG
jgi:small redox-active disulfide protein 2